MLTTVAIGDDSRDRTYQERRQHPDYEKAPNGEAILVQPDRPPEPSLCCGTNPGPNQR